MLENSPTRTASPAGWCPASSSVTPFSEGIIAVLYHTSGKAEISGLPSQGSIGAAKNLEALKREGITHVLNASPIVPCFHRQQMRYKVVSVYDDAQEDIAQYFAETNRYINKGRRKGGILVHCYAGMSRSATLVLAYLIACERMSLSEALQITKLARPAINPNSGFMLQLMLFQQQIAMSCTLLSCAVLSVPTALSTAAASGRLLEYKGSMNEAEKYC